VQVSKAKKPARQEAERAKSSRGLRTTINGPISPKFERGGSFSSNQAGIVGGAGGPPFVQGHGMRMTLSPNLVRSMIQRQKSIPQSANTKPVNPATLSTSIRLMSAPTAP